MLQSLFLVLFSLSQPAFAEQPNDASPQSHRPVALNAETDALGFVQQRDPLFYADLMQLKDQAPKAYQRIVRKISRSLQSGRQTPDQISRGLQITKLEYQLRQSTRGYSELSSSEQKNTRAEMLPIVEQLFELKQESRRERAAELELRLNDLKAEIDEKGREKTELVSQYIDYLIVGRPRL